MVTLSYFESVSVCLDPSGFVVLSPLFYYVFFLFPVTLTLSERVPFASSFFVRTLKMLLADEILSNEGRYVDSHVNRFLQKRFFSSL